MTKKPHHSPAKAGPSRPQAPKAQPEDTRVHGMMAGDKQDPRLRCPKDATYMEKVHVGDFHIDRCAGCGAMWFDALELDKVLSGQHSTDLVKHLDIGSQGRPSGGRALGDLVCPRCRSPLIEVLDQQQRHVKELACTVCGGILLDKGELRDLSEFTIGEKVRAVFARVKGS